MQNTAAAQAMAAAAAARKRALASLDNGLADSALEPGFAQLRVQAREEVRRHDTQQAELSAHNRAAHKITVEFAAWKQRFDEETSTEIDVVYATGWNCCSQLGLTALDCEPQPGEGQSSSSEDDDEDADGGSGGAALGGQAYFAQKKKHTHKPGKEEHVPSHALGAGAAGERARGPVFAGRCLWVPRKCARFQRRHVTRVACGGRHTLLYCDGRGLVKPALYGWGRNVSGQLGLAGGRVGEQLSTTRAGRGGREKGRRSSEAAQLHGRMAGVPYGEPDEDALRAAALGAAQGEVPRPTLLPRFAGLRIAHLALGEAHSMVAVAMQAADMPEGVDDHALFCFGSNEHGQLGLGDHFLGHDARWCGGDHFAPCSVMCLHRQILFVACGEAHTVVATAANLVEITHVMACGDNRLGQLGVGAGDRGGRRVLTRVPPLEGKIVEALACGAAHSLVATAANAHEGACLWAWGCNTHAQLGMGHASCDGCEVPRRVLFSATARAARDGAEKEFLQWEVVRQGNAILIQRLIKQWLHRRRQVASAAAAKIQAVIFRGPAHRAHVAGLKAERMAIAAGGTRNADPGKKRRKKRRVRRGGEGAAGAGIAKAEVQPRTAVRGARRGSYSGQMLDSGAHIFFGAFCSRTRPLTAVELRMGSGFAGGRVVSLSAGLNHSMAVVAPPAWELSADDQSRGWTERTDGVAKGAHVLWGFGDHAWGQLGIGQHAEETGLHRPTLWPTPVRSAWMEQAGGPREVACGRHFTLVLARGEPLPELSAREREQLLTVPPTKRATLAQQRAAAVKQRDGTIFAFGDNQYGQLGIGPPRGPGRHTVHGGTGTDLRRPATEAPRPPGRAEINVRGQGGGGGGSDSDDDSKGNGNPMTRAALRRASVQVLHMVQLGRQGGAAPQPGLAAAGLFRSAAKPPPVPYERCIHEPRPVGFVPNGGCRIGASGVGPPTGQFVKLPMLGPGACHAILFKDVDPGRLGEDASGAGKGESDRKDGGMEAQDPHATADRAAYEQVLARQRAQREKAVRASGGLANMEAGAHPMSGSAMARKSNVAEHRMMGFIRELGIAAKPADWYLESKLNPRFRDGVGRPDSDLRKWGGRQRFVDDTFKELAVKRVADAAAAQKAEEFERLKAEAHAELQAETRARAVRQDARRKAQELTSSARNQSLLAAPLASDDQGAAPVRAPKYI